MDPIIIAILVVILIVLIVSGIIIFYNVFVSQREKKMYQQIEDIFNEIINDNNKDDFKFTNCAPSKKEQKLYKKGKLEQKEFQHYIFSTPSYEYYIMVVPNYSNAEICVNNSVKWQLRKSFNDNSMNFVPDIESFMRQEIKATDINKAAIKIFVIYPSARSLLQYINECEMRLVTPKTDVYGTMLIRYNELKENKTFIKLYKKSKKNETKL